MPPGFVRGVAKIIQGEFVDSGARNEVVVLGDEAHEVGASAVAQGRHEQGPAAVTLLDIDGYTKPDFVVTMDARFAVGALHIG
jgi:hypothetical protein